MRVFEKRKVLVSDKEGNGVQPLLKSVWACAPCNDARRVTAIQSALP